MNDENLIRFDEMPPDKHKELSRRGGIASGEKRRDLAYMRELALQYSLCFSAKSDAEKEVEEFRKWQKMQRRKRAHDK